MVDSIRTWPGVVEEIRRAATIKGRKKTGRFSIEGIRLLERAMRANFSIELVIMPLAFKDRSPRTAALVEGLSAAGVELYNVPQDVIDNMTGGRDLGGIIGLAKIPQPPDLAALIARDRQKRKLFLAVIDVQEPGNVGALLRTAHAAGADGFLTAGISDPYHPKAVRTSMGSIFKMPMIGYSGLNQLAAEFKVHDIELVATAVTGGTPLPKAQFAARGTAVMVGSEAWGLSSAQQAVADKLVSIPMPEGVDSFSVNAATAIILYEIGQR